MSRLMWGRSWKTTRPAPMLGRDVPPSSGKGFVEQLQAKMQQLGIGQIATVMGRYYAMDRDKRWDRLQKAYDAIVCGQAPFAADGAEAIPAPRRR
mgnify:CR=1 FL=1